jgi:hypothetical protein
MSAMRYKTTKMSAVLMRRYPLMRQICTAQLTALLEGECTPELPDA